MEIGRIFSLFSVALAAVLGSFVIIADFVAFVVVVAAAVVVVVVS